MYFQNNQKKLIIMIFSFMIFDTLSKNSTHENLKFLEDDIKDNSLNFKDYQSLTNTLNIIYTKISNSQSKKDISFRQFPPRFSEIKGLFSSYIHLNFQDEKNSFLGDISRNKLAALDMNMFVTNFVLCSLIEALPYSDELSKDEFRESISIALEAISLFRDRNYPDYVPIYNFWKQVNINGTWSQSPETMVNLVKNAPHLPESFLNLLRKINLSNLADFINVFEFMCTAFEYAFRIPPDADDTSVNMALTGMLYKMVNNTNMFYNENIKDNLNNSNTANDIKEENKKNDFDKYLNDWFRNNSDYETLFKLLKFKAYRPFLNSNFSHFTLNSNNSSDLIDPRTYFVIRKFLEEKFNKSEDLILPTTWIYDVNDENKYYPLITMPFFVNNIDFNVVTNFLFGTTYLVLNHPDKSYISKIFDDEVQKMYSDTVELIVFAIKNDIISWRPDLALLYYPSIFDFYWLISRVYSSLKNSKLEMNNLKVNEKTKDIASLFEKTLFLLEEALKNDLTNIMIEKINKNEKANNESFFIEFLGNTQNYKRNEDSLFASALGLNSLLNIWTHDIRINSTLFQLNAKFDDDTPQNIKLIIEELSNYLVNNINKFSSSYEGAFFSGSVKSPTSNAPYFPGNFYRFLNGTYLENHSNPILDFTLTSAMKGFVPETKYQELLQDTYFGQKTPVDFVPFYTNIFPYWSSPSMTLSINYLALSKYRSLLK